ncbi:MAG: flagellar hook-basal body complex protein FliE [Oscillospiraceae bacterium]|nr:flagellar hook-basal body complex protein FliE [Oscillospiraceae bacterium]
MVNPLQTNLMHLFNSEPVRTAVSKLSEQNSSFADVLTESFKTTNTTDAIDKGSSLELLMGENDDLSGMLIDAQKAELALQLTLQIRNKIIDAYNEVMRMSV